MKKNVRTKEPHYINISSSWINPKFSELELYKHIRNNGKIVPFGIRPIRGQGNDIAQKLRIALEMMERKPITYIKVTPEGIEEKTYRYPYKKDEFIESVTELARMILGIKLEELIK